MLDAYLVLHNREVRSSSLAYLGSRRHDCLRVRDRHCGHRVRGLEGSKLRLNCLRVSLYLLLCIVSVYHHASNLARLLTII